MGGRRKHIGTLQTWLAAPRRASVPLAAPVLEAIRAQSLPPALEGEVAQTLAVLDELGADAATLSAALLYACVPAERIASDLTPAILIEGQREAEKVWSI